MPLKRNDICCDGFMAWKKVTNLRQSNGFWSGLQINIQMKKNKKINVRYTSTHSLCIYTK